MKRIIKLLVIIISLSMSTITYADYIIQIDENYNPIVTDNYNPVSSYPSDLFTLSNGVLTLNPNYLYDDVQSKVKLTITTDNKEVHLNRLLVNSIYTADGAIITIKDANLVVGGYIHPEAGIEIYDSTIDCYAINNEDDHPSDGIRIENSNIVFHAGIYTEGDDNSIIIRNSTIDGSGSGYIEVQLGPRHSKGTFIENSTIKNVDRVSYTSSSSLGKLFIKDSYIETNVLNGDTGIAIDNSTIIVDNEIKAYNHNGADVSVNNSYVTGKTIRAFNIDIKDSYVFIESETNSYSDTFITAYDSMTINNSNVLFNDLRRDGYVYWNSGLPNIVMKNNDIITDIEGNPLHIATKLYTKLENPTDYYLFRRNDESISNSLKVTSRAKVKFSIKGGVWSDGTSEDKVITKDVWTKLTSDEIPRGMKNTTGSRDGYWEIEPNTEDFIKGDITYTYIFREVKGVSENPKTGVFRNTILILLLTPAVGVLYIILMKKELFKLK